MRPSIDDLGPSSHSYMSQRLRLHYLDWGNSSAPTLILLHGGRDHAHSWDWTARELRKDWHIVAPDLRGHGDSDWSPDGSYQIHDYVYDFAQLIEALGDEQVTIVAHSLGGYVASRYAAIFPEKVRKLVSIEGIGLPPREVSAFSQGAMPDVWRRWVETRRTLAGRPSRRYPTMEAALERMQSENKHLSAEQAYHLTVHGCRRNEDGSYSWKFDHYVRSYNPLIESERQMQEIWSAIACPLLLCQGKDSFLSDPAKDGCTRFFRDSRIEYFENAGHWLHHDRFDHFLQVVKDFL